MWGPADTSFLLHARGIEHHSKGVENCMAALNLVVATGRIGREGCGYAMITGQGNGQGAREQGQKCDQLPGARDLENPAHREYIATVWGVEEPTIPHTGLSAVPLLEAIHDGRIKGLLLLCFNPAVSLPDGDFIREALGRLEFFAVIDFFMSETARYADIVLPGSLMEEDEGTTTNVEGRVIHHRQVVKPPAGAREDWRIICDLASRLGVADKFPYQSTRDIFEELRVASKGGVADYAGITWERIDKEMGVFWPCPSIDHPGTPRLYEGWRFGHPDGKAHFQPADWRPAAEEPDADYPVVLTTGRVVSQYLSGTQTRRIGALVDQYPQPRCEMHPRLAGSLGIADDDFVKVESRRGSIVVRAHVVKTIRPDTVFVPYHWPLDRSANTCTIRAIDPISKIPEFKICAVRVSKTPPPADDVAALEPEAGGIR
jgi:assimilatory nitrate reductase catalytic subunit